jgi:ABC-2 type transport system ATP-binding protein
MPDAAIRTESISKTYRSGLFNREIVHALRDVSLTVQRGEIFGLLGPNGAGKTTLLKILLGIAWPTTGRATLFGRATHEPAAREHVGFLPEKHRFPNFLTSDQMLHLYGRLSGVSSDHRAARIPELLDQVDMTEWRHTKLKKFSKGMMQRVGLAQALLGDPDLVFLDEPTDGVDPVGRREIRDILLWLHDQGKTIFLNSHLLSEVEKVCTRVAILNRGELVREGTIDELTAMERVYTLHTTRIHDAVLDRLGDRIRPADPFETSTPAVVQYQLQVEDRADLNAVLDRLRSANVELDAVQPVRRSLEDYFIDVVSPPASEQAAPSA